MKVDMIKQAGGVFVPASDEAADYLNKFKTGEMYPVELKLPRNHSFHRKVFAFFEFVFQYWSANKTHWENMSEPKQKDSFRKELIKLAGFTEVAYSIDGQSFTVEAKSISYGAMSQQEFEELYNALINAAMRHVFNGVDDEKIYNRLVSFF